MRDLCGIWAPVVERCMDSERLLMKYVCCLSTAVYEQRATADGLHAFWSVAWRTQF